MYRVSGSLTMSAAAISSADIGSRRQALGFSAPLRYAFSATLRQGRRGDAVLAHVARDLDAEELGGHHQPGLAVPVGQAPVLGSRVERAARVLVEADREGDLGGAGTDRVDRRRPARCRRWRSRS